MAKKSAQELFNELDELGGNETSLSAQDLSSHGKSKDPTATSTDAEDDLSQLQSMLNRPTTPRVPSSTTSTRTRSPVKNTPTSTGSTRSSGEQVSSTNNTRRSGESASFQHGMAPSVVDSADANPKETPISSASTQQIVNSEGGSWWGGISAIASAAVKQAEAAVKEIQQNEEAQKWAEQMKGNYGVLRGFGGELRSRALPTFTTILHTLAPPISQHERLQIHITHDFTHYPSLDPMIYQTFSRVMAQVEGGDLLVIQRGSESSQRRASEAGYTGSGSNGWNDGPWWRQEEVRRSLNSVKGLVEGTKLVRASAEAYANDFFASRGGLEEVAKEATSVLSESNPVRSSDIFLAIQAISHTDSNEYFGGGSAEKSPDATIVDEATGPDELTSFAIYLHDPIHSITFSTLTQSFPQKWADWLDAESQFHAEDSAPTLPEEILEMIRSGGVDPREWISEWMEEIISLGVGIVAQRYVARRMGVGEAGLGRGKRREQIVESFAGEAARAI